VRGKDPGKKVVENGGKVEGRGKGMGEMGSWVAAGSGGGKGDENEREMVIGRRGRRKMEDEEGSQGRGRARKSLVDKLYPTALWPHCYGLPEATPEATTSNHKLSQKLFFA
jgi:hypothetical protein